MTIKSWYMSLDDNARAIEAYENNISKFYHHNIRPNSTFQTGFYKKEKFSYIKSVKVVPTLVLTFIAVLGTLLVESAGTINAGEPVASDGNGKAVKATGDALINGYAQDSVTEGQEVRVLRGI